MSTDPKADLWKAFLSLSAVQQVTVIGLAIAVAGFGFAIGRWAGRVESKAEITSLEDQLERVQNTQRDPVCEATIISPRDGDDVPQAFQVEATIREVPEGFVPWIVTTDRVSPSHYWPQSPATLGDGGIWTGDVNTLGGKEGKRRSFALVIVGPDGQLLIDSWQEGWVKGRDPLKQFTRDTVKCAERDVVVRESPQKSGEASDS